MKGHLHRYRCCLASAARTWPPERASYTIRRRLHFARRLPRRRRRRRQWQWQKGARPATAMMPILNPPARLADGAGMTRPGQIIYWPFRWLKLGPTGASANPRNCREAMTSSKACEALCVCVCVCRARWPELASVRLLDRLTWLSSQPFRKRAPATSASQRRQPFAELGGAGAGRIHHFDS